MAANDYAIIVFKSPSLEDPTVSKPVAFSKCQGRMSKESPPNCRFVDD